MNRSDFSLRIFYRVIRIILILLAWENTSFGFFQITAQRDSVPQAPTDTSKLEPLRFIFAIGSFSQQLDSSSAFHSSQFIWRDAKYAGDLLWTMPGFFLRELGEPGQPQQMNFAGMDSRGISIQLDGRTLHDPVTGAYNLYDIPLEYVDQLELVDGALSSFYGSNASAATLNFVTHQYNNNRPLTKLRYLQGPFEHTLSDGIFAQNVARGFNFMFGFQRQVTNGRFPNSKYDSWNVRNRLRYNYSNRLNFWLSDFYNKSSTGFNGGIDVRKSPSIFDEVTALVRTREASQTVSRRDVTLGGIGKFFDDSTSTSHMQLYYTTVEREYRETDQITGLNKFLDFHSYSFWGSQLEQRLSFSPVQLHAGLEFEHRSIGESRTFGSQTENYFAFKGKVTWKQEKVEGSIFVRQEQLRKQSSLSYGAEFRRELGLGMSIFGGYSNIFRLPTMQELYWIDSTVTRTGDIKRESHVLSQIGLRFQPSQSLDISLSTFTKRINGAIIFLPLSSSATFPGVNISNVSSISVVGATANILLKVWNFELTSTFTFTDYKQADTAALVFPKFMVRNELSYRDTWLTDALDLKLGVRSIFMSKQDGYQFLPPAMTFTPQADTRQGSFSTFDLFAIGKLGDAYITLVWENPLKINYVLTSTYPMPSRNIKLGVNWVFVD